MLTAGALSVEGATGVGLSWQLRQTLPFALLAGLVALLVAGPAAYADQLYALSSTSNQFETARVGTIFPQTISVRAVLLSNFNTPVPGLTVVFTAPSSGASGTFATTGTNSVTVTSDANGFANAPVFTANNTMGTYTITITGADSSGNTASPNAVSFTNSASAATGAALISTGDGSNQAAQINTQFATQMSAAVFNGSNQPVAGVTVTFAAPGSGASGTFSDTGSNATTAVTSATGLATAEGHTNAHTRLWAKWGARRRGSRRLRDRPVWRAGRDLPTVRSIARHAGGPRRLPSESAPWH